MTHLLVAGLNYHSTPLAIRERFIIPQSCLKHAHLALSKLPQIKEAVVLSTCNRTEVYAVASNVQEGFAQINAFFTSTQSIADHDVLQPNFKLLRDDVALHLFRVAAGLDSMVLGEGQIMSQVKSAYKSALEAGTSGPVLDYLFKQALNCGKRVRSETTMGRRAVSVSSAAIELAKNVMGPLKERTVVVIGAGKMAQICTKLLLSETGQGPIYLLNRSKERIERFLQNSLPNRHRLVTGLDFNQRHKIVSLADLVIVSTSAPHYLLSERDLLDQKCQKELCIVDISVPRNVEPSIGQYASVQLFHADDLSAIVSKNLSEREALVSQAQRILFETLDEFQAWQRSLLVVPTIAGLREKIEAIRQEQMAKSSYGQSMQASNVSGQQHIEEISRAIVNQILHHPTVQLKATKDYEILRQQAEALRTLFRLDTLKVNSTATTDPSCSRSKHQRTSSSVST
jgi:glutamyl-tRNA reductase